MTRDIFSSDLKTDPWWWEAAPRPRIERPLVPGSADVVIVGAGFTGLGAALTLARAGKDVVVLEARRLGEGASSRNGGMIGSGHHLTLAGLTRSHGRELGLDILREGLAALSHTTGLIEREQISCHYRQSGRFRAACTPQAYDASGHEMDILIREIGLEAEMLPKSEQHRETNTDFYFGGCIFRRHGSVHPALLHQGLLDRVLSAGVQVLDHTGVVGIGRGRTEFTVVTRRGKIRAGDVISATNGYTGPENRFPRRRIVPAFSYIIATEEKDEDFIASVIPGKKMIVETRAEHSYYRPSPDGRRILFGARAALRGLDERVSGTRNFAIMTEVYPQLKDVKISHSWKGQIAFTRDWMPHMGVHGGVHYALGYSGSGVAMAPYLGHRVAQKVLGEDVKPSAFERVPLPSIPFYWGRPWFLPLMDGWRGAKKRFGR